MNDDGVVEPQAPEEWDEWDDDDQASEGFGGYLRPIVPELGLLRAEVARLKTEVERLRPLAAIGQWVEEHDVVRPPFDFDASTPARVYRDAALAASDEPTR